MSASRSAILDAVRRGRPAPARLPAAEAPPDACADESRAGSPDSPGSREVFARSLEAAGGRCLHVAEPAALAPALRALPELAPASRVYSALPGYRGASFAPDELADPRRLEVLEAAVLPGAFGVAENGAVWVEASELPQRAVLWLAEHLVLVVPGAALVPDLAAAYARLRFDGPGFGVFVAGPSKTADIEQALVVGAQGPRSTTVVLCGR